MDHLLKICKQLGKSKSKQFNLRQKAKMLPDVINDAWNSRKQLIEGADHKEMALLVLHVHTHRPLLMSLVHKILNSRSNTAANSQTCMRVVNALINLLDIKNAKQVLKYCNSVTQDPQKSDDDNDPPLVTAIMKKDIPFGMIEMLLQEGCDPNSMIANNGLVSHTISDTNNSSLYCALCQNRRDIVKLLLDNGATVTNDHCNNDFHNSGSADIIACIDDYNMVKLLLEHDADPNSSYYDSDSEAIPDNGGTALILAIFRGNKKVVQLLLEWGAKVEQIQESQDYSGDALDFAYSVVCENTAWDEDVKVNYLSSPVFYNDCKRTRDRVEILKLVLTAAETSSRQTVLLRDAMLRPGCQDFAQMFLNNGVDVNFMEEIHHRHGTPFLCILMNYKGYRGTTTRADFLDFCYTADIFDICTDPIKKLISGPTIDNGAIYKYLNEHNYTPSQQSIVITSLHFSDVFDDALPQLQQIIDKTTNINAFGNSKGHVTPLHCAVGNRSNKIIAMLLADKQINVDVQDERGESPLYNACYNIVESGSDQNMAIFDLLLTAKCIVDLQNNKGSTPLSKLSWWIRDDNVVGLRACEKLLKAGANPNNADNAGKTPVTVVRSSALARLLLNNGGNIKDAPKKYQIEYRQYRTQLTNGNQTLDAINLPKSLRLTIQILHGIHCERCNELITRDLRLDTKGQMCMNCYYQLHPATITKKQKAQYTQWISEEIF